MKRKLTHIGLMILSFVVMASAIVIPDHENSVMFFLAGFAAFWLSACKYAMDIAQDEVIDDNIHLGQLEAEFKKWDDESKGE